MDEFAVTVTPADGARQCDADGCGGTNLLSAVEADETGEKRVLCPTHRVEWERELTEQ